MTTTTLSSEEIYRAVGLRIRAERQKRHLTQEVLATSIKLRRTSITNIEKGRQKLLLHTLVAIAEAMNLSPSALLTPLEPLERGNMHPPLPADLTAGAKNWVMAGITAARNRKIS